MTQLSFFSGAPGVTVQNPGSPSSAVQTVQFNPSQVTADSSGVYNTDQLTSDQRNTFNNWLQCPSGTTKVVSVNSTRCRPLPTSNQGDQFNTLDRLNSLSGSFNQPVSTGLYNEWVSPYEPTGVTQQEVDDFVAGVDGATDYLFVTETFRGSAEGNTQPSTERDIRDQQRLICESRAGGALVDNSAGGYSVCVVAN